MRVIAGSYRSRPLAAPSGRNTRPTSDRLRETLFNVLAPRISGASFADLYAGTGAVGIEALSRGAAHVLFVERAASAVTVLRANLRNLGIDRGFAVETQGTAAVLDRLIDRVSDGQPGKALGSTNKQAAFDIVFLDPPYEAGAEYTAVLKLLGSGRASHLLAPGAVIIVEHSSKLPLPVSFGELQQRRTLKQGDASLTFYSPSSSV